MSKFICYWLRFWCGRSFIEHYLAFVFKIAIWSCPAFTTCGWQWPTWQTLLIQSNSFSPRSVYMYWPKMYHLCVPMSRQLHISTKLSMTIFTNHFSWYRYLPSARTIFRGSCLKNSLHDGPTCFLLNSIVSCLGICSFLSLFARRCIDFPDIFVFF